MRIGILTLPLHTNYGGILQAYALQTVLERMGHDVVEVELERKRNIPIWKFPLSIIKRVLLKYICRRNNQIIFFERHIRYCSSYVSDFIQKYINQLRVKKLSDCKGVFDAMICGSDQIWRYKYYPFFENDAANVFFKFLGNDKCKRIAYAASFGAEKWEYPEAETKECSKYAQLFQSISVRESSGVGLCNRYLGVNAQHVLDPTMLLCRDGYVGLIKQSDVDKCEGEMFCYILDAEETKSEIIQQLSKQMSLTPFYMSGDLNGQVQPPVEAWLRAFQDSKFVVTDSFHACVFSILFHKQFVVIGNKERGMARINSLLSLFGLEDRLINEKNISITTIGMIDYEEIDKRLECLRERSFNFLYSSLKECYERPTI